MLVYCDWIAEKIRKSIADVVENDWDSKISAIGHVKSDLDEQDGFLVSTTKTIWMEDQSGRKYRVTVEEID